MKESPAELLDRLIRERGEDYASLSRLIGRNPAYVQQFIKRGVPRRLDERDRATLARYFRIDEQALGAPKLQAPPAAPGKFLSIPWLDVEASAGPGAFAEGEGLRGPAMLLGPDSARRLGLDGRGALSMIRVAGDSMAPTLGDGDDIMVDGADGAGRLRDGIYVLRRDDVLMVKRVTLAAAAGRILVSSDNRDHPAWPECAIGDVEIVGRVLWSGRRIR